jgi:anti-anti-sigma regulatory factor
VLRIDVVRDGRERVIRLSGRLEAAGLHHLLAVCVPRAADLTLDLSELRSVDDAGCRSLQALREAGAEIIGEAMFIRARLNDAAARQTPQDPLRNEE